MFKQRLSSKTKLQALKDLVKGTLDVNQFRESLIYTGFCRDGLYTIHSYKLEKDRITEEEYKEWLTTLRSDDRVLMFVEQEGCEPIAMDPSPIVTVWHEEKTYEDEPLAIDYPKPVEEPVKPLGQRIMHKIKQAINTDKFEEIEHEVIEVPAKKTGGLMSEYGITWGITKY